MIVAGLGFLIASLLKFKQHKENPTQVPIGTPIAMVIVGVALLYTPNISR
jgi:intracellular multiplication protein IcmD